MSRRDQKEPLSWMTSQIPFFITGISEGKKNKKNF